MISVFFPSYWQMRGRIAALSADNTELRKLLSDQQKINGELVRKNEDALALFCRLSTKLNGGDRRRDERGRYCK